LLLVLCPADLFLVDVHVLLQTSVIIDPYAKAVLSRRRYGELGAQLDYESDEVLGLAETWPQAAAFLPKPTVSDMTGS
jgi:isoamylase